MRAELHYYDLFMALELAVRFYESIDETAISLFCPSLLSRGKKKTINKFDEFLYRRTS